MDLGLPHSGLRTKIPLELTTVTTVQELHRGAWSIIFEFLKGIVRCGNCGYYMCKGNNIVYYGVIQWKFSQECS